MNELQKNYTRYSREVLNLLQSRSVYCLPCDNIVSFSSPPRGEHDEGIIHSNTNQQKDRNKINRLENIDYNIFDHKLKFSNPYIFAI